MFSLYAFTLFQSVVAVVAVVGHGQVEQENLDGRLLLYPIHQDSIHQHIDTHELEE